jgi:hypothetical protein
MDGTDRQSEINGQTRRGVEGEIFLVLLKTPKIKSHLRILD